MKKILIYGVLCMTIIAACSSSKPVVQPQVQSQDQPGVFPEADKYIALTFDDGPMGTTGTLLEVLAEQQVKATFFLVGQNTVRRPNDVLSIIAGGHEIGNHSNDHAYLGKNGALDADAVRQNLAAVQEAVYGITGAYPVYFRAPYLDYSPALESAAKEMGMSLIGISVDSRDWESTISTSQIITNVVNSARDGGIILLHEHSGGDTRRTINAIPVIVQELRKKGFAIMSLGELAQKKGITLEAGKHYNTIN